MKPLLTTLLCILACCLGFTAEAAAQEAAETITFTASSTTLEDNPNAGTYTFTLFSPDGQWKAQLFYHSTQGPCGTFTSSTADGSDDAFDLSGTGRYYNFVRKPSDDMHFYAFTDIAATVTDETTAYRIIADCTASNGTRFHMEGTVPQLIPTTTVTSDLGYAYIVENAFYGTYAIEAENDDYALAYGIASTTLTGTFYRADLLRPELTDKRTGQTISVASATAVHTADGDATQLVIDIISDDLTLYHLTMHNEPVDITITDEYSINMGVNCVLQDLRELYGCYQIGGQNSSFAIALAFKPEAFDGKRTEWTTDDFFMPYTTLLRLFDETKERIIDVRATGRYEDHLFTLRADITCLSGRLYHVVMGVADEEYMPEPDATVDINFGRVAVVDYSKGLGTIGIGAVQQGKYQLRFCLNTTELEGNFTTRDVVMDYTDIMVVGENTYRFHDAQVFKATAVKMPNGRTAIDVNLLATDNVLYHCQMYVDDLACLKEKDEPYNLSNADGALMVALQQGADGDYAEYNLQYQLADAHEVFSFYFSHRGTGIAGEYAYSDGTLAADEQHTFIENGVEVRIAPVAGTLSITELEEVVLNVGGTRYSSYLYGNTFEFVGQNGVIYRGEGENFLICIDEEGSLVDITTPILDAIHDALASRGYAVRKQIGQDGRISIVAPKATYQVNGQRADR